MVGLWLGEAHKLHDIICDGNINRCSRTFLENAKAGSKSALSNPENRSSHKTCPEALGTI